MAPGCGASPEEVFRRSVADPRPASVQIIQAQASSGLSVRYWSHFRISPNDLAPILAAHPFQQLPAGPVNLDFHALLPPQWWKPDTFGAGLRYFQCEDPSHADSEWRKILLVNAGSSEVYFVQFYYY